MTPIATILITAVLALIAWIGKEATTQLKKIADSVQRIEVELGVLANDHSNLKHDHEDLKKRVDYILDTMK